MKKSFLKLFTLTFFIVATISCVGWGVREFSQVQNINFTFKKIWHNARDTSQMTSLNTRTILEKLPLREAFNQIEKKLGISISSKCYGNALNNLTLEDGFPFIRWECKNDTNKNYTRLYLEDLKGNDNQKIPTGSFWKFDESCHCPT